MIEQAQLTGAFMTRAQLAADAFVSTKGAHEDAKGGLAQRIAEAVVARLLSSDAETAQTASRWVGDAIPKEHKAKASSNAYRSALMWRLDSATVAGLRAMVTPEAATNEAAFSAVAISATERLGAFWADYKADKKAAKKPEAPKAAGVIGNSVPKDEREPDGFTGKTADPVMTALTAALEAIAALKALGEDGAEALTMVAEALAPAEAEALAA